MRSNNQGTTYLILAEGLADFKPAGLAEALAVGDGETSGVGEGEGDGTRVSTEASRFKGVDKNRFLSQTR